MRAAAASLLCLTLLGALSGPANAQPPPPPAPEQNASDRADDLVKRANALAKQDRWAEALPLYREAWGLKPAYDIAGNLGVTEAALGKDRDASEHLSIALASFPTSGKREHRKLLELTLEKARAEVAALTITVSVPKAEVFVDDRSVGTAPLTVPAFVEPGAHAIDAKLAGYKAAHADVSAAKGASQELALTLVPDGGDGSGARKPVIITGSTLAVVTLVVGGAFLGVAKSKASTADTQTAQMMAGGVTCASPPAAGPCASLHDLNASSDTFHNAGVPLVVAGSAIGLGTLIYALLPRSKKEPPAGLRVLPAAAPRSAALWLNGAF